MDKDKRELRSIVNESNVITGHFPQSKKTKNSKKSLSDAENKYISVISSLSKTNSVVLEIVEYIPSFRNILTS